MTPAELASATLEQPKRVGRYDVFGLLRSGGMGTVYEGVDREHGTSVALKTLNHLDADSLLRFKNEFRAVAGLSHPNLVSLYQLGREGDLWFFTMERIHGLDFIRSLRGTSLDDPSALRTREEVKHSAPTVDMAEVGKLPAQRLAGTPSPSAPDSMEAVRSALVQLVRGVTALHAAGLLHLDLKPSNVLIDHDGRVVVLDFGLTRSIAEEEPSSAEMMIAGTPSGMAPEQFTGRGIAEASDWYAVGLILYRALTGVAAFDAEGLPATPYVKRNFTPTSPRTLVPQLPDDLSSLAVDLLSPDPARRPKADEILARLAAAGEDGVRAPAPRSRLVGRQDERYILSEALESALDGRTAVVELCGPSGVGKTALLDDLLDDAQRSDGVIVLHGRCYEREAVPYKAFDAMLDELAGRLSKLSGPPLDLGPWTAELALAFPVLARVPGIRERASATTPDTGSVTELRRRALEALRALFAALAERIPVVLAIDDLQWIDIDSSWLLARLMESPTPPQLLLAVSYRPGAREMPAARPYFDVSSTLDGRDDVFHRALLVEPLAESAARELAATRLAELSVDEAGLPEVIAREAEGMPFFVEELVHLAAANSTT